MRTTTWSPPLVLAAALAIASWLLVQKGSAVAVYTFVAVAALSSLGAATLLARRTRGSLRSRKTLLVANAVVWIAFAVLFGPVMKDYTPSTFFALVAGACSALSAVLLSDGEQG